MFKFFYALIFISAIAYSQTVMDITISPSTTKKVMWYLDRGNSGYTFNADNNIGTSYSTILVRNFKTAYKFDFSSLLTNYQIISCSIEAKVTMNWGTYKSDVIIKLLTDNPFGDNPEVLHNRISSSPSVFSFHYDSVGVKDITSEIQNKLSQGYINLGADAEYYYGTSYHADISFVLKFKCYERVNLTADNNFTALDGLNGRIFVDDVERTAPFPIQKYVGNNVKLQAVSNQIDNQGYVRVWNNYAPLNQSDWSRVIGASQTHRSYSNPFSFQLTSTDKNSIYKANLRRVCNVNFQNSFPGVGNGGVIRVNQTQYNSPTPNFPIVEQNEINSEAIDQTLTGINYTFTRWDDNSTQRGKTFTVTENKTYTAYFSGTPQPPSIAFNLTQNQPIKLTWTANTNGNVIYKVHRDVYHRATGWTHGWHHIATLPAGSNSYTDGDYIYGWGSNSYYLYYKVEAYYTTENTSGMSNMISTEGFDNVPKISLNIPTEYGITSFPNPFNPTTTLLYKLVDDSDVLLEVYDITGKLIDRIVNEQKQSGYHSVVWNTSNINGETLSSGMYLYRFTAKPINGNNIYIKANKLLLMK